MLDLKFIRDNLETVKKGLAAKNVKFDFDAFLETDQKRKKLSIELDELRAKTNTANDEIGRLIKEKKDPKERIAAMKKIAAQISDLEPQVKELQNKLDTMLLTIPNIPHSSVPVGGPAQNKVVRSWGQPKKFGFTPKTSFSNSIEPLTLPAESKTSTNKPVFFGVSFLLSVFLFATFSTSFSILFS